MKRVHFLLFVVILVLAGCSNNSENQITHLPFQTEEDGRWGLIDMEGNVLIEDEFKSTPSVVIDGRFCVKNSDGLYEFYTAEKKFKQIGGEYLSVGYFSEGLAPVVKKDSRITYINKDGEVVFELTKYKDDPIEVAYPFENGIARVETSSGKSGCINTKGEFVVSPIYSSIFYAGENILLIMNEKKQWGYIDYKGKILVEPKYSVAHGFNDNGYAMVEMDGKQIIINRKGKEILKLKDGMKISSWADEDLMPYSIDNKSYGYLNLEGEKVIKLSSNIKEPTSFFNGYATFKNSDNDYGTIDEEGEIVIRAKYDELNMYNDFILYEDDNEWGFLSYSGDVIKRACYKRILPFFEGNKYTYAKDGDEWILIDKKGEDTKKIEVDNIGYYDYDNFGYPYCVESDYLDIDVELKKVLKINNDGSIGNLSFNIMPSKFTEMYYSSKVNGVTIATTTQQNKTFEYSFGIYYFNEAQYPIYERQWVSNRWGGYYDNVISGYSYNDNNKVRAFVISIKPINKLREKAKEVKSSIYNYIASLKFKIIREENSKTKWNGTCEGREFIINMNCFEDNDDNYFVLTILPEEYAD